MARLRFVAATPLSPKVVSRSLLGMNLATITWVSYVPAFCFTSESPTAGNEPFGRTAGCLKWVAVFDTPTSSLPPPADAGSKAQEGASRTTKGWRTPFTAVEPTTKSFETRPKVCMATAAVVSADPLPGTSKESVPVPFKEVSR